MFKVQTATGLDLAFGGDMRKLLPSREEIPESFWRGNTPQNKIVQNWFFRGLKNLDVEPAEGVDIVAALRHLWAIMASSEPKHEHKEAAVAWLISQWFTKFDAEPAK